MSWAEAHDNRQSDARPPFGVWSVARTLARVSFTLLPAVDVADGQAVRLVQGEAGTETGYGDPLDAALAWQRDGAEWIHLVDLDAAFGRGSNAELLAGVVGTLDVAVELSGGIRDDASLDRALATGCARVNLGTAALENPQWCAKAIARAHQSGSSSAAVPMLTRAHPVASAALSEASSRMPPDSCTRTSSSATTAASRSALSPRPNAASRSTRWIHSAPSRCQARAASRGAP